MEAIKKICKVFLVIIACLSFTLMFAETVDGGIFLPWNLGCAAALVVSAKLLDRIGAFDKDGDDVEV